MANAEMREMWTETAVYKHNVYESTQLASVQHMSTAASKLTEKGFYDWWLLTDAQDEMDRLAGMGMGGAEADGL
ncbi:hypothetical protein H0H93_004086, partial [Arthromyces matolae]